MPYIDLRHNSDPDEYINKSEQRSKILSITRNKDNAHRVQLYVECSGQENDGRQDILGKQSNECNDHLTAPVLSVSHNAMDLRTNVLSSLLSRKFRQAPAFPEHFSAFWVIPTRAAFSIFAAAITSSTGTAGPRNTVRQPAASARRRKLVTPATWTHSPQRGVDHGFLTHSLSPAD